MDRMDNYPGRLLAGPDTAGLTISGGITGGALTFLALGLAVWLVIVLIKRDKMKIPHLVAGVVVTIVFLLTPIGQLAFGAAMGALDSFAGITV
jgi:hypothetical protein